VAASGAPRSLRVDLPGRAYRVHVGPGLLSEAGERISAVSRGRSALVVADRTAYRFHGKRLLSGIGHHLDVSVVRIAPGEGSKSLARVAAIYDHCRRRALTRTDLIIAFGGGVTGDLAGFAAATWLRGIDLVMVPTTLLSQVDSSVGGKVGVNHGGVKNLVGAFHQPRLVLSDTRCLSTLPPREIRSALAEVVKCAMIADRRLLARLERTVDRALAGDPDVLADLVLASCRIKARIVEQDERESGIRAHLNYGHTLGHALEAAADGRLRHGEAVALGMRGAAAIAVAMGRMTPAEKDRQDGLLDRIGLPGRIRGLDAGGVLAKMKWDKKVQGRSPRFVLTVGIGSATLAPPVEPSLIVSALEGLLAVKALHRK